MQDILSNHVENAIVVLLSQKFPQTPKEIHSGIEKLGVKTGYKNCHKSIKNLEERKILQAEEGKYKLNKEYLYALRDFMRKASKSYDLYQNMFMEKLNSKILDLIAEDEKKTLQKSLVELLDKYIMRKLDEWYAAYYNPEHLEWKKIAAESLLKNKNVLEIGCGTGRITFPLAKYSKHVVSIDNDESYVEYCREKASELGVQNLELKTMDVSNLEKLDGEFDIIVSGWVGLQYAEKLPEIISNLHSKLKKGGKLIVIEAYPDSDYMHILNHVKRREKFDIVERQDKLKNELFKIFDNMREEVVNSYYKFPNFEKVEETFKIELIYEEDYEWGEEQSKKLRESLDTLKDPLTISEPPLFFICEKK